MFCYRAYIPGCIRQALCTVAGSRGHELARGLEYNFVKGYSDVRKDTANWIALADYDLETARHMLATKRYLYVI